MQVAKTIGRQCLLKQTTLMTDPIVRGVGLPMDLVSLILDLAIMVRIDLGMMKF